MMQDDNRQKLSAVGKTSARSMNWLADIGRSLIYWCWLIRCQYGNFLWCSGWLVLIMFPMKPTCQCIRVTLGTFEVSLPKPAYISADLSVSECFYLLISAPEIKYESGSMNRNQNQNWNASCNVFFSLLPEKISSGAFCKWWWTF